MIEALACGTPVIARPCGSVPEVIRDGVTGYIATSVEDLTDAVGKIDEVSRHACRDEFERRFTAEVMAAGYESLYRQLASVNWKTLRYAARPEQRVSDGALPHHVAQHLDGQLNRQPLNRPRSGRYGELHRIFSHLDETKNGD